jgi:2-polyprenyl-3-methyl-5-hydroxy-6-metoxy-1,4-benzoquinol methylase
MLSRELHRIIPHVTAIDLDEASIEPARRDGDASIDYVVGDVLTHPFEPASFDFIASVAALHHIGAAEGLTRMADLLRPGGVLAVVGLASSRHPKDLAYDLAAVLGTRFHRLTKTYWQHSAPIVWPPPETYGQVRSIAQRLLPGVDYRRRLLWRYTLVWSKP